MKKTIQISQENAIKAYNNANKEQKELLEALFGKETFKPKDICDRIKTFDDAVRELGESHPLVLQYKFNFGDEGSWNNDGYSHELEAFLKLRIITAALNEGWEPKFTTDEYRYYPWFWLYTKEEIESMNEEKRNCVVGRASYYGNAYGGLVYAHSSQASSYSSSNVVSRLAFKTRELAEYAGKQFIELYANFCFIPKAG